MSMSIYDEARSLAEKAQEVTEKLEVKKENLEHYMKVYQESLEGIDGKISKSKEKAVKILEEVAYAEKCWNESIPYDEELQEILVKRTESFHDEEMYGELSSRIKFLKNKIASLRTPTNKLMNKVNKIYYNRISAKELNESKED